MEEFLPQFCSHKGYDWRILAATLGDVAGLRVVTSEKTLWA